MLFRQQDIGKSSDRSDAVRTFSTSVGITGRHHCRLPWLSVTLLLECTTSSFEMPVSETLCVAALNSSWPPALYGRQARSGEPFTGASPDPGRHLAAMEAVVFDSGASWSAVAANVSSTFRSLTVDDMPRRCQSYWAAVLVALTSSVFLIAKPSAPSYRLWNRCYSFWREVAILAPCTWVRLAVR